MPDFEEKLDLVDLIHPQVEFVNRLPDLGVLQERIFRSFKTDVFQTMRVNLKTLAENYDVSTHDNHLSETSKGPVLYGVMSLQPLIRGMSLVSVQGQLLAALVDDLFGAGGIVSDTALGHAEVSIMETRIGERLIKLMADVIGRALRQHFDVEATVSRYESHPALASVGDATEPFCVMSTTLSLSTGSGSIAVAIPYRGLETHRDVLSSPASGTNHQDADTIWKEQMEGALADIPVPVAFEIGTISLTAAACAAIEPGQILPLRLHRGVRMNAGSTLLAEGRYGEIDSSFGVILND